MTLHTNHEPADMQCHAGLLSGMMLVEIPNLLLSRLLRSNIEQGLACKDPGAAHPEQLHCFVYKHSSCDKLVSDDVQLA